MPERTRERVILLQGGALRAAFGAGVLYELGKCGVYADTVAAASASVPTAAYYATHQFEALRAIWTRELGNSRLVRYDNLLRGAPIYDIDYLVRELFQKKYPLDVRALKVSSTRVLFSLYNYSLQRLEIRDSKDPDIVSEIWHLLRIVMILHDRQILWGTQYEQYVDGELDPLGLFKLPIVTANEGVIVIWNEPSMGMSFMRFAGQKLFLLLQARGFPREVKRMLHSRAMLLRQERSLYEDFCRSYRPIVIKPDSHSFLDGLDVLRRNNLHLKNLFEHGREKARVAMNEIRAQPLRSPYVSQVSH